MFKYKVKSYKIDEVETKMNFEARYNGWRVVAVTLDADTNRMIVIFEKNVENQNLRSPHLPNQE